MEEQTEEKCFYGKVIEKQYETTTTFQLFYGNKGNKELVYECQNQEDMEWLQFEREAIEKRIIKNFYPDYVNIPL